MKRKLFKTVFLFVVMLIIANFVLPFIVSRLTGKPHPLLTDITCIESGNVDDFYWKLNQVFISSITVKGKRSVEIRFSHSVPNFEAYYVRIDREQDWKRLDGDVLSLPLPLKDGSFSITARNHFGSHTSTFTFSVAMKNGALDISPIIPSQSLKKIPFRFEQYNTPGIEWLRKKILPIVGKANGEWEQFLLLRKWVHDTIPCGTADTNATWEPVRIVKQALTGDKTSFLCDDQAVVFVSACVSAGLNARMIHLKSTKDLGHYAAEVWSDSLQKWVYMDPLYDFSLCQNNSCYSALELHNLYLKQQKGASLLKELSFPSEDYIKYFYDFQIVTSNDFLKNPLNSVVDLLLLKIRTLRWIDDNTPPLNKLKSTGKIFLYYYVPKLAEKIVFPFNGLPFCFILTLLFLLKSTKKE